MVTPREESEFQNPKGMGDSDTFLFRTKGGSMAQEKMKLYF
jgi:hypothetical protein